MIQIILRSFVWPFSSFLFLIFCPGWIVLLVLLFLMFFITTQSVARILFYFFIFIFIMHMFPGIWQHAAFQKFIAHEILLALSIAHVLFFFYTNGNFFNMYKRKVPLIDQKRQKKKKIKRGGRFIAKKNFAIFTSIRFRFSDQLRDLPIMLSCA